MTKSYQWTCNRKRIWWNWWICYWFGKKVSPPGGLEPPTFRLTAERASRLRHGGYLKIQENFSINEKISKLYGPKLDLHVKKYSLNLSFYILAHMMDWKMKIIWQFELCFCTSIADEHLQFAFIDIGWHFGNSGNDCIIVL